jgi:hypothetical protein
VVATVRRLPSLPWVNVPQEFFSGAPRQIRLSLCAPLIRSFRLDRARKYGTNNQDDDGRRNEQTVSASTHEFMLDRLGPKSLRASGLPNYAELQRQKGGDFSFAKFR